MLRSLLAFIALGLLTGCATRCVLVLDEFVGRTTTAPAASLFGESVFVEVSAGSDLMNTEVRKGATLTEPLGGYAFSEMSEAEVDRWDERVATARKTGSKGGQPTKAGRHSYGENAAWTFSVSRR